MVEEDEEIEENIQQVSKNGDLSPRQANNLKSGAKKDRSVVGSRQRAIKKIKQFIMIEKMIF